MHPFYSPVKGWTSAIDLRAGDILVMLNGEYVVVEQVQHELLESPETTYNFEVEDFHTYYVGKYSILAHNACENLRHHRIMLPQIIHERERGRLTRKNGQRPCPCSRRAHEVKLPGSACQP